MLKSSIIIRNGIEDFLEWYRFTRLLFTCSEKERAEL